MKFDFKFKNKKLLEIALTHRSYLNEHKKQKLESNERLEFLGDAVLELVVSIFLYKKYLHFPEGKLTALRSTLVQTKTLALVSQRLNLGAHLKLSRGEKEAGGENNPSILADTFEALVGALYQDAGFEAVYNFILKSLIIPSEKLFKNQLPYDYKSKLQEEVQAQGFPPPSYQVLKFQGPEHRRIFTTAVFINKEKFTSGKGKSKQEAEQQAAKKALEKLKIK